MSAIVYSTERLADCVEEILPMVGEHNEEVNGRFWTKAGRGSDYSGAPDEGAVVAPDPDVEAYLQAECNGMLRVFTARIEAVTYAAHKIDGNREHAVVDTVWSLIGYALFLVTPYPHFKGVLAAKQDLIYVDPAYRKSGAGLGLLRYAERELEGLGVDVIFHEAWPNTALASVLTFMKYRECQRVFAKRV